jgi:cytochrome c
MSLNNALARNNLRAPAIFVGALLSIGAVSAPDAALAQSAQRGVVIARTYCAKCHSIDKLSPSALKDAPPFRDLHRKYPVENLEESLSEGIVTGHPSMPEFQFDPGQVRDFIAFLNTLK